MDSASASELSGFDGGEERLLATANNLLEATGIGNQPITSFEELQLVATDLFVALFEVMFFAELAEIERRPETFADSVHNANTVLDILGQVLGSTMDLPECVTGAAVASGDKAAVAYLLRVFAELGRVTTQHQRQQLLRSAQAPSAQGSALTDPPITVGRREVVPPPASQTAPKAAASPTLARPASARPRSARGASGSARKTAKKSKTPPSKRKTQQRRSGGTAPPATKRSTSSPRDTHSHAPLQEGYPDLSGSPPGAFRGMAEPRAIPSPPEGHLNGQRHEGQATSGEGLGPNGRPGTAVGGARSRLRHFAPQPVPPVPQQEGGGQSWRGNADMRHPAPSPIVDIWADAGTQAASQAPPQPISNAQSTGRAAPVPPPHVPRSKRAAAAAPKRTTADNVKVKGVLSAHSKGVNLLATSRGAGAKGGKGGKRPASSRATSKKQSSTGATKARNTRKVANPTGAATLAGQRAAALKRSARAAQAAKRREEAELQGLRQRLAAAHNAAIKDRVANWRVRESRFLKRAAKRAAASQHTQRVMTIRTTRVLEDAQRATLALRLRRASEQARITAEYTKAIAAQEREAALEAAKAAAADSQAAEAALRAKQEAALHQLGITQALMKEAAQVQAHDLRVAAAGQAQALRDSTRDILASGRAVELAAAQARESRDAQWTVQQFGEMSARETRPLGARPTAVTEAQARWLAEGGDAQVRLLDIEAAPGSAGDSGNASVQEDSFLAHVGKQLEGGAMATQEGGGGYDFNEDWVQQQPFEVHGSGGVSAESSGYLGYPAYKAREVPATTTSRQGMIITRANAGLTPGDGPRLLNVRGATFGRTTAGGGGGGYTTSRTEWL